MACEETRREGVYVVVATKGGRVKGESSYQNKLLKGVTILMGQSEIT